MSAALSVDSTSATIDAFSNEDLNVPLEDDRCVKSQLQQIELQEDNQNEFRSEIKPEDTEHYKMYENIFNSFVLCGKFIGVVPSHNWVPQKNVLWCICCFTAVFSWVCMVYTQVVRVREDWLGVLQVFAIYGFTLSGTMKLMGYLKYRHYILSLCFAMRKTCLKNVDGSIRAHILKTNLSQTYLALIMFFLGVVFSLLLFTIAPFKEYIDNKKLTTLLPIEIVFVDQSTNVGLAVANIIMLIMGSLGAWGSLLYGATFIFIIFNHSTKVELIRQDFQNFDEMWTNVNAIPKGYKQEYLKNICKKTQDLVNYMDVVSLIYEKKLFYYYCSNYLSMIICLFEVKQHNWIPGYGLAIGIFIEMLFYSLMGTKVSMTNERLCGIVCDTKWYTYDLQSQKTILLLLHRCQNFHGIQLGPIGPLHVVTYIEIVKSIYSYYTVLTALF